MKFGHPDLPLNPTSYRCFHHQRNKIPLIFFQWLSYITRSRVTSLVSGYILALALKDLVIYGSFTRVPSLTPHKVGLWRCQAHTQTLNPEPSTPSPKPLKGWDSSREGTPTHGLGFRVFRFGFKVFGVSVYSKPHKVGNRVKAK